MSTNLPYAGLGQRACALFIDTVVLYAVNMAAVMLNGVLRGDGLAVNFVALCLPLVYFACFEALTPGGTPGQRAVGLQIRRVSDGGTIALWQSAMRYVMAYLSLILACVPITLMQGHARRQGWHDRALGVVVLDKKKWASPPIRSEADWPRDEQAQVRLTHWLPYVVIWVLGLTMAAVLIWLVIKLWVGHPSGWR